MSRRITMTGENILHVSRAPEVERTRCEWNQSNPVSTTVVQAVREVDGSHPGELDPLYESVDPDALDELFGPGPDGSLRLDGHVSFTYAGYLVVVFASGAISIRADDRQG